MTASLCKSEVSLKSSDRKDCLSFLPWPSLSERFNVQVLNPKHRDIKPGQMRMFLMERLRQRKANNASNANLGPAFHGHSTNYKLNSTNTTNVTSDKHPAGNACRCEPPRRTAAKNKQSR